MNRHILVFGTFDGLHEGHLFFLRSAKSVGGLLTVAIARDAHVQTLKQKVPTFNQNERREAVEKISYVDQVIFSDEELGSFSILDLVKPDIIVLGHDQDELDEALRTWMQQTDQQIELKRLDELDLGTCTNCTCGG